MTIIIAHQNRKSLARNSALSKGKPMFLTTRASANIGSRATQRAKSTPVLGLRRDWAVRFQRRFSLSRPEPTEYPKIIAVGRGDLPRGRRKGEALGWNSLHNIDGIAAG